MIEFYENPLSYELIVYKLYYSHPYKKGIIL